MPRVLGVIWLCLAANTSLCAQWCKVPDSKNALGASTISANLRIVGGARSGFGQNRWLFSDVKKHPDKHANGNGYGEVGDDRQKRGCDPRGCFNARNLYQLEYFLPIRHAEDA